MKGENDEPSCVDNNLSDTEWQQIEPLLPVPKPIGKRREVDLREVVNAVFYRADNVLF